MTAIKAIVPATPELLREFYGHEPGRSMRAFVGMLDGKPVACFGVYYCDDKLVLFSDIRDEARPFKKSLVQGAFKVRDLMKELNAPVYAVAGCVDGAVRLLERMGFQRESDMFVWRG